MRALEGRYLAYALSTIMHPAVPDARDGLKLVGRRLLDGDDPAARAGSVSTPPFDGQAASGT
jgi:hypothetical protein